MKVTFEYFEKRFEVLEANFGFKTKVEIIPFIFEQLKDLDQDEFDQGFNRLMSKTRQEWSEIYDYGKTPTVADWRGLFLGKRNLTIDALARMEIEKILLEAQSAYADWEPSHDITKKVIGSFKNGLATIHFDLFDHDNYNKCNIAFYRRDLMEKWMAYYDRRDEESGNLLENHSAVKNLPTNQVPEWLAIEKELI